ncbi:DNA glycosylase AlkZ-like family protein [Saccharothrix xinjiangensis]|uniref:DNA glycosylase AlkZ-like family protein n=1 Tax=Saccharothrix xinjiangensis TaxID=204798 RepID=A0ABV9Y6I7_9PSEU
MTITWDQVRAWRLRRQFLEPRTDAPGAEVVSRLCGAQAQVKSSAALTALLRQAEPRPEDVEGGLADGVLLKTWAMRGTLHLLKGDEAGDFLSLAASARTWHSPPWQREFGATPAEVEALVDAVSSALDGRVLTRDELVAAVAADAGLAKLEARLRSGWGALLKPLAWQGALCHGPSRGAKVTFARPGDLAPGWRGVPDPDEAAPRAIAAYLGAHGPATPDAFNAWLMRGALRKTPLRRWFADMGDRLTKVDVEGEEAFALSEHVDELATAEPSRSVRLLGAFDQYVLGPGTNDPRVLAPEHRARVSRAAGWIAPVVVVGGRVTGVWEQVDDAVVVSMFPGARKPSMSALRAEAGHLAKARGTDVPEVRVS